MDTVASREVTIVNQLGFHARAAAAFVKHASAFNCDVFIHKNGREVNGKSIMGILMLAMPMGESFKIVATGQDAELAAQQLYDLVCNKFGEDESITVGMRFTNRMSQNKAKVSKSED
ncbi:MAG: HPr family phosphocarrier protein [Deferribacteraceae bacterium]|jgi:phosphocarrier protein|nr:HPr family phosphocarrier protein [Deferribacteraceae bacterium]